MEVVRATEEYQRAGAYYVRIQAMARQHHIPLPEEFDEIDGPGCRYIVVLDEGFLCADALLRLAANVTDGLRVNEKIVARAVREYLPFIATENLLMEAVKRGGDRQALHEIIRRASMEATARMKEGEPCDLPARLAAQPEFGISRAEIEALLEPRLYIGRCPEQVTAFLEKLAPVLAGAAAGSAEIDV